MDGDHNMGASMELEDRIVMERRISKAEENLVSLHDDIQDVKKTLRWLSGLVFSLNTTIIGILTKGFGLLT
jgi:hypothetical protein